MHAFHALSVTNVIIWLEPVCADDAERFETRLHLIYVSEPIKTPDLVKYVWLISEYSGTMCPIWSSYCVNNQRVSLSI